MNWHTPEELRLDEEKRESNARGHERFLERLDEVRQGRKSAVQCCKKRHSIKVPGHMSESDDAMEEVGATDGDADDGGIHGEWPTIPMRHKDMRQWAEEQLIFVEVLDKDADVLGFGVGEVAEPEGLPR